MPALGEAENTSLSIGSLVARPAACRRACERRDRCDRRLSTIPTPRRRPGCSVGRAGDFLGMERRSPANADPVRPRLRRGDRLG